MVPHIIVLLAAFGFGPFLDFSGGLRLVSGAYFSPLKQSDQQAVLALRGSTSPPSLRPSWLEIPGSRKTSSSSQNDEEHPSPYSETGGVATNTTSTAASPGNEAGEMPFSSPTTRSSPSPSAEGHVEDSSPSAEGVDEELVDGYLDVVYPIVDVRLPSPPAEDQQGDANRVREYMEKLETAGAQLRMQQRRILCAIRTMSNEQQRRLEEARKWAVNIAAVGVRGGAAGAQPGADVGAEHVSDAEAVGSAGTVQGGPPPQRQTEKANEGAANIVEKSPVSVGSTETFGGSGQDGPNLLQNRSQQDGHQLDVSRGRRARSRPRPASLEQEKNSEEPMRVAPSTSPIHIQTPPGGWTCWPPAASSSPAQMYICLPPSPEDGRIPLPTGGIALPLSAPSALRRFGDAAGRFSC